LADAKPAAGHSPTKSIELRIQPLRNPVSGNRNDGFTVLITF